MLRFAPHRARRQQNNLRVDLHVGWQCGTAFLKEAPERLLMRHNRCESDVNMLEPCKQADGSIASSNFCVALVMIFQEVLTKIHQCSPEAQPDLEKPPKQGATCAWAHTVIHNTHQSTPSEEGNMGRSGSKYDHLSLRLTGAWNRLYIALAKEQQSENFRVFSTFLILFYSCNQTYGCSHTLPPPFFDSADDLNKISAVFRVRKMTGEAKVV